MSKKDSRKKTNAKSGGRAGMAPKPGTARAEARTFKDRHPFFARYWELLFFLVYAAALSGLVLPKLRFGFDVGHDSALLSSSFRIWHGQVPFRDFYPWYGPLFHYLVALCAAVSGKNLFAVKFFVDIISPILSMGILMAALRKMNLPASSRYFVLLATPILGLERIYYCGSLRNFLPILLVALWDRSLAKRQKWVYFSVFPSGFLLYFFSPEVGIYTLATAPVFLALAFWSRETKPERIELLSWAGAGLVLSLIIFGILFLSTRWLKNYLEYVSVLSNNLAWSHGLSRPAVHENPHVMIYYIQPLIHLLALGILLGIWRRKKVLPERWLLILVLTVMGLLLYNRTLIKAHPTHVQFAFLPALIIMSFAFSPLRAPVSAWQRAGQILEILLILYGGIFFKQQLQPEFKGEKFQDLLGIHMMPKDANPFLALQEFAQAPGHSGEIAFPLKGVYCAYLDRIPSLPFDDLHYLFYPSYRERFLQTLEQRQAQYAMVYERDMFWDYPGENLDAVLDYLDQNYQALKIDRPVWIYQRRPEPVSISGLVKQEPDSMVLDRDNGFQFSRPIPPGVKTTKVSYLEFSAEFDYPIPLLERLSMPIVQCRFDGKLWRFTRPENGRQRINPMPGKHRFRVYFMYPFQELNVKITFPGILNPSPSSIRIEDIQWRQLIPPHLTPRTAPYALYGKPKKY